MCGFGGAMMELVVLICAIGGGTFQEKVGFFFRNVTGN